MDDIHNHGIPGVGGGDGSSPDNPVAIEAEDTMEGIAKERAFIASVLGNDWRRGGQALHKGEGGRHLDWIEAVLPDGTRRAFWFDITDFYGKI